MVRAARGDLQTGLREGGRGARRRAAGTASARLLVAGQVALVLPLLVGAGLLIRTAMHLQRVDARFRTSRRPDGARLASRAPPTRIPARSLRRSSAWSRSWSELAGVASASMTSQVPIGPGGNSNGLIAEAATLDVRRPWTRASGS